MALLDGYPQSVGAKREAVLEKAGPSHYDTVTTGSPPSGGQTVYASEFGLKYLESVESALSDDGQYFVKWTPAVSGKAPVTSGILMWITAAGGAEVAHTTDLHLRTVRLTAKGF